MSLAPPVEAPVEVARPTDRGALVSRLPYLPGLDGMRAIAVVAVMIYHANSSWLPGGYLGVEMFFVISGYLITLLLISERESTYRVSLKEFWFRRARRLLPALYVMMALVIVGTALFEPDALGQLRGDVIAGLLYVSNWYQILVGLGYTAAADFAPLRHLWSLAVEEQFYIVWPLVMVVLLRRYGTRRISDASRWLFLIAIGISLVGALIFPTGPIGDPEVTPDAYWWLGDKPISKLDTLYIGTISRSSGLLMGAALAMLWRPYAVMRGPLRRKGHLFDLLAILALAVFAWLNWNLYLVTPAGAADPQLFRGGLFLASFATLVIIAAVTHRGASANRLLGNRLFVWIGTRSYGLYLYHWPIYQFIRKTAGSKLTVGEFVLAMVATVLVTETSYRLIETPIRRGQLGLVFRRARMNRRRGPRRTVIGGLAIAAALSLFLGATLATAELRQNEITEDLTGSQQFVTDLADRSAGPPAPDDAIRANGDGPGAEVSAPTTLSDVSPVTTIPATTIPATTVPATTVPATTVAPTTVPPPPPAPVQAGVVNDMSKIVPLAVPETVGGFPLIALGDSVMLGAAEELQAAGFAVDAVKSRQMISFLPDVQRIRDDGTFGSVVVVHLGTNGKFSQGTLDQMMALLADVPVVVMLTGKANRGWIAGNNDRLRALPGIHPNVTVLDWEVLSRSCEGRCFYDDGIHLTQEGQNFYTSLITRLLGLS